MGLTKFNYSYMGLTGFNQSFLRVGMTFTGFYLFFYWVSMGFIELSVRDHIGFVHSTKPLQASNINQSIQANINQPQGLPASSTSKLDACKIKIIKKKNAKIRPCIESIDNDRPFGTRSISNSPQSCKGGEAHTKKKQNAVKKKKEKKSSPVQLCRS